ncbi:MAG: HVO_A0114 family putative DNA-binding protein [Promethearchaeota archaeon]
MTDKTLSLDDIDQLELLGKAFTGKRLEVLRAIATRPGFSISDIEREVGINRTFLTETLQLFQALGLITMEREGRKKIPRIVLGEITIRLSG